MSDFVFNASEEAEFRPYDGDGAAALLPFDGYVSTRLARFELGKSTAGNPKAKLILKVNEDDLQAFTLYHDATCGGTDSKGKSLRRQILSVFFSAGIFTEESYQAAVSAGEVIDVQALLQQIQDEGLPIFCEVQARVYNGKESSSVNNVVTKTVYDRNVAGGTHRVPRAAATAAPNGTASAQAGASMLGGVL